jgi:hypothetical protein
MPAETELWIRPGSADANKKASEVGHNLFLSTSGTPTKRGITKRVGKKILPKILDEK